MKPSDYGATYTDKDKEIDDFPPHLKIIADLLKRIEINTRK